MGNSSSSGESVPKGNKKVILKAKLKTSLKTGVLNLVSQDLKASSSVFVDIKADASYIEKLTTLDLSSNPLKTVPVCVYALVNLKHLSLSDCRLQGIGDLSMLVHVVQLKLSRNALTNIALDAAENSLPPNLTRLDLSHNQLSAAPSLLASAPSLTTLVLSHNQVTQLTHLRGCAALAELDLDHNQLQELPEFLAELANLLFVSLAHNRLGARSALFPAQQSLPAQLLREGALQQLDLRGNPLTKQQFLAFDGVDQLLQRRKLTRDKLLQGGGLADSSLFGLD